MNFVRKIESEDVESLAEIESLGVRAILASQVNSVTHTIVYEKFRVTMEHKIGTLISPFAICVPNSGMVFGIPSRSRAIAIGRSCLIALANCDGVLLDVKIK